MKRTPATTEIGAYEAKTRLPDLLRGVRAVDGAVAIDRFRRFMRAHPVKAQNRVNVRALIEDGRV